MDDVFLGRLEVRPPLNEAERAHLTALAESSSTLRGTPTGRGDTTVPFAHLAWSVCADGCCLTWDGSERSRFVAPTLEFLVDHLLGEGARAAGHAHYAGFTCDHVLDGVVTAKRSGDDRVYVAEVSGNRVVARESRPGCAQASGSTDRRRRPRPRPANVIEFRPRRA